MVGRLDRLASADPLAITRAMLEGALHKANDAVYADGQQDWDYAMQSYADSCALLGRCMDRTDQTDEEGSLHWRIMEGIVRSSFFDLSQCFETWKGNKTASLGILRIPPTESCPSKEEKALADPPFKPAIS